MHQAELLMTAHLEDPKCTEASVGALYALLIAANPKFEKDDWKRIHAKIRDRFDNPSSATRWTDQKWLNKMDAIKQRGWRLHEACCEKLNQAA